MSLDFTPDNTAPVKKTPVAVAATFATALAGAGLRPCWPVEANEIFVALSPAADDRLRAAGAKYNAWPRDAFPASAALPADHRTVRLVTSFATTSEDIERFVALLRGP